MKMVKETGEVPIFVGEDNVTASDSPDNISFVLTYNEKNKEYTTLLIVKNARVGCVISSGSGKITLGKPV